MGSSSSRRVVVTGMGLVTSLGGGLDEYWAGLIGRRSGIGPYKSVPTTNLPTQVAGEAPDRIQLGLARKELRQVFEEGHEAGILRPAQRGLAQGLFAVADRPFLMLHFRSSKTQ